MDNNNQQTAPVNPMMNTAPSMPKKTGPMIGILVVVLILIIAALYLFASKLSNSSTSSADNSMMDATETAAVGQSVQPVTNTSDDMQSLQSDLDSSTKGLDGQGF